MSKTTLTPLRGFCLIKLTTPKETPTASAWIDPEAGKERQARGQVLAIGKPPLLPNGTPLAWEIEIGDIVWFKRYGGEEIKEQGEKFLLVPSSELLGVYK